MAAMPAVRAIAGTFEFRAVKFTTTADRSTALPVAADYLCATTYRPALFLSYTAAYNSFHITALTAALTANFTITITAILVMHIQFDLLSFSLSRSIYAVCDQSVALTSEKPPPKNSETPAKTKKFLVFTGVLGNYLLFAILS